MSVKNPVTSETVLDYNEASIQLRTMRMVEPESAWDILSWVCDRAIEEPRRMRMNSWGEFCVYRITDDPRDSIAQFRHVFREEPELAPPCGTAACVAGWCEVRVYGKLEDMGGLDMAKLLTGGTNIYHDIFVNNELVHAHDQGTRGHVEFVVGRVRQWMAAHEALLKSRIIGPGGELIRGEKALPSLAPIDEE